MLSNEEGYKNLVDVYRVHSLRDGNGVNIRYFGGLVDGGKYTLGRTRKFYIPAAA